METRAYEQFLHLEHAHWWFRGRRRVYLGLLEGHLGHDRPARTLDLGCGMGGFMAGLGQLGSGGGQVIGSDMDPGSLARCAQRGFEPVVVSNGYALPFAAESFDLVCLFDALEHIPDDARAMQEVARVLKPGGRVFLSVPAYQFLYANNDRIAQHQRRYTRKRLAHAIESGGLQVERNTHSNVFLFPLILPMVLAIKAIEMLLPRRTEREHTNLSLRIPRFLHDCLYGVFAAELPFSRRFDLPWGHSIAAIARRPAAD